MHVTNTFRTFLVVLGFELRASHKAGAQLFEACLQPLTEQYLAINPGPQNTPFANNLECPSWDLLFLGVVTIQIKLKEAWGAHILPQPRSTGLHSFSKCDH
jgi:hypothetical protein